MRKKKKTLPVSEQVFNTELLRIAQKAEQWGRLGTAANYRAAAASFCQFLNSGHKHTEFNRQLIQEYEYWLRAKGLIRNSTSFYMRNLRAMCRQLNKKGIETPADCFESVYTGIDTTRKRALTEQAMSLIKHADLSNEPTLAYTRDLFLFCFYCRGMAFVDLAYLRHDNIYNGYIRYVRRKTGRVIEIRLERCMTEIINRYPGTAGYLFPVLRSQEPACAFKQYRSAICVFNRMLKQLATRLGIPKLSSYMSRHSWATIARRRQVPLSVISQGMGHSSEAITQIYLASFSQQVIDDANRNVINI